MQGKHVEMTDILELRNAANDAQDLRQPLNLQDQVTFCSAPSADAALLKLGAIGAESLNCACSSCTDLG